MPSSTGGARIGNAEAQGTKYSTSGGGHLGSLRTCLIFSIVSSPALGSAGGNAGALTVRALRVILPNRDERSGEIGENSWWKNRRGEWYLVIQAALFLLVIFGPRSLPGASAAAAPCSRLWLVPAVLLFAAGLLLAAAGALNLGRNLTPLPRLKEDAALVVTGAYRLVRHPIYSGIIFMAFGYALWRMSWLTAAYALLLFIFFDVKSRREERWLQEKFPEYRAYRERVRKLIPFVY